MLLEGQSPGIPRAVSPAGPAASDTAVFQQALDNLRRKGLLLRLKNDHQSVDLVGCSASNFVGSAFPRTTIVVVRIGAYRLEGVPRTSSQLNSALVERMWDLPRFW